MFKNVDSLLLSLFLSIVLLMSSCLKSDKDVMPDVGGDSSEESSIPDDTGESEGGETEGDSETWNNVADDFQNSLNFYWNSGGSFFTENNNSGNWTQYWPSAHGMDVLIDAYSRKEEESTLDWLKKALQGIKAKNGNTYINHFYDDMEWLALATLRAYQATNDEEYKEVALELWEDIKGGWDDELGGGIWWNKDRGSKNTPSNMPAAILAARLYDEFHKEEDLDFAKKIYDWEKSVLYDGVSGAVYDNINKQGDKNTTWRFTYNQGTFLGAGLELYKITQEEDYLKDAIKAADYTLNGGQLTDHSAGILKDEGAGDGGLFKGVFVRYFTELIASDQLDKSKQKSYIDFLVHNGEVLLDNGTDGSTFLVDGNWDKMPDGTTDFTVQLSGIMLMEALARLENDSLIP